MTTRIAGTNDALLGLLPGDDKDEQGVVRTQC